jgi:signal peptidase I
MPTSAKIIEQPQDTASRVLATETAARFDAQRASAGEVSRSEVAVAVLPKSLVREYFESAVVTIIMALFGMTFIVQAVKVPTGSMQNTINIGDQLLVNKFIFAPGPPLPFLPQREIRRGDVIVFKYPGNKINPAGDSEPDNIPYRTNYVKRVIGLPGETIEVRGEDVYINGELLQEHRVSVTTPNVGKNPALQIVSDPQPSGVGSYTAFYSRETRQSFQSDGGIEPASDTNYALPGNPTPIPEGHYFAMGDNRENSADSRVWGLVPRELIVGRAMFVYWSYDLSDVSDDNPVSKFLRNSRWDRSGTMIK